MPLEGSEKLLEEAATTDKTLKVYDGMLHAPLCEPLDVRQQVTRTVIGSESASVMKCRCRA